MHMMNRKVCFVCGCIFREESLRPSQLLSIYEDLLSMDETTNVMCHILQQLNNSTSYYLL